MKKQQRVWEVPVQIRIAKTEGSTLATRTRGDEIRAELEHKIAEKKTESVVIIDLHGVQAFSHSFADAAFGHLIEQLQRGRYGKGRYVMFIGANEFTSETLDRVLAQRRLSAIVADEKGRATLRGSVAEPVMRTLAAVERVDEATTSDLARRLRTSQQAVNNRLAKLVQAGAVHRVPARRGSGRPYVYRARTRERVPAGSGRGQR